MQANHHEKLWIKVINDKNWLRQVKAAISVEEVIGLKEHDNLD